LAFAYIESVGIVVESDEFLNHNDGIFRGRLGLVRCVTEMGMGLDVRFELYECRQASGVRFDSSQQLGFPRASGKEVIVLSIDGGK
jgi:hypothetical protein